MSGRTLQKGLSYATKENTWAQLWVTLQGYDQSNVEESSPKLSSPMQGLNSQVKT